ncbi:MAG: hypothetical protein K0R14_2055 [Burkholderiales bacterium]|jgi:hypothetical protein|nr:hypothetical protein [Burkholderiales bacterium]
MNKIKNTIISSLIGASTFIGVSSRAQTLNYFIYPPTGQRLSVCDGLGTCNTNTGQMNIGAGKFCMQRYVNLPALWLHQVVKFIDINSQASVSWDGSNLQLENSILVDSNPINGKCPIWGTSDRLY